ncbi:MAG: hypothetical protein ACJAZ2_001115 [Glaciecola sp.]|jgi:hypothetical protein
MKNLFTLCLFVFTASFSFGQNNEVVHDEVSFTQDSLHVVMSITLDIDSSWIVYDSIAGENGPIPFSISFEESSVVILTQVNKPKLYKKYDDLFEMDIYYLKGTVTYVVTFSKKEVNSAGLLSGSYEFMSCNLTSGVCLPPVQHSFSYSVK